MLQRISNSITAALSSHGITAKEDAALYAYGIRQLLTILLNIGTTLLLGCLFGLPWESLWILAGFIPLRSYAGGYHAKTPLRCWCMSVVLMAAVLTLFRLLPEGSVLYGGIYAGASLCILAFAPTEDCNKPLDALERRVYRRRTWIVWGLESVLGILLFLAQLHGLWQGMVLSMAMLGLLVPAGRVKNAVLRQSCANKQTKIKSNRTKEKTKRA